MPSPVLVWFRNDLRLADHAALGAAVATGRPVIPLYVHDDEPRDGLAPGSASRWWLHGSLAALDHSLRTLGSRLVVARGRPEHAIAGIARESGATALHHHRQYGAGDVAAAARVHNALRELGIESIEHASSLLVEPDAITTRGGTPFRVFTPFHRALTTLVQDASAMVSLPAPNAISSPSRWPRSIALDELGLQPDAARSATLGARWNPGEAGALRALEAFAARGIGRYAAERDHPGRNSTSALSPHLRTGELSPRQVVARLEPHPDSSAFLREIVWREFAHHLLAHHPSMIDTPLDERFASIEWRASDEQLDAWRMGRTGYPIIDAGMRELRETGWMHNRVRMLVGSFLVKDLLAPWQSGAEWFWETLVDADAASNAMNWQWVAGCGADAAPYFRIFNPVAQAERFDPDGAYVRRWVPEVAGLSDRLIHRPWTASPLELAAAGIDLGRTYPEPIVDHAEARARALETYRRGLAMHR